MAHKLNLPQLSTSPKTPEFRNRLQEAFAAGKKAFYRGSHCAPALDRNIDKLLEGYTNSGKAVIEILSSWQKGWHTANIEFDDSWPEAAFETKTVE